MTNRTSTSSAFTAGSWEIDVNENNEYLICSPARGCLAVVAQLENESEEAANARLIAAAPALLEALKDVTASLDDFYAADHRAAGQHFGMALLERMTEVIVKAGGA